MDSSTRTHLVVMNQDPVLEVPAQRAGQHRPLQVSPLLDHVLHGIPVRDSDDILVDDGPVQAGREKGRRPRQPTGRVGSGGWYGVVKLTHPASKSAVM